jgi:hypothetical protein
LVNGGFPSTAGDDRCATPERCQCWAVLRGSGDFDGRVLGAKVTNLIGDLSSFSFGSFPYLLRVASFLDY